MSSSPLLTEIPCRLSDSSTVLSSDDSRPSLHLQMGGFTPRLTRLVKYSLLGGTVLPPAGLGQHVSTLLAIGALTLHYQDVGTVAWQVTSRGLVAVIFSPVSPQ